MTKMWHKAVADAAEARFRIFAFSPLGVLDAKLAIAASRAGAIGVVNGESVSSAREARPALEQLAANANAAFGLRLGSLDPDWIDLWAGFATKGNVAIVDYAAASKNPAGLRQLRETGSEILVEIISSAHVSHQIEADVGGFILKGHESGGWVGEETSFILLQKVRRKTGKPLYVRGGVTPESAAAIFVGGGGGVVLDDQLLLLRESVLAPTLAPKLRRFSGVETIYIDGGERGRHLRIWGPPGTNAARALAAQVQRDGGLADLHATRVGWGEDNEGPLIPPLGQDGVFAAIWAERYGRIAFAVRAIRQSVKELPTLAGRLNLLGQGGPLAVSHGARLPLVQGPMTHVSDRAAFAKAIADAGGLPTIAASLMSGEQIKPLLEETRALLGDAPWGVGLLGFLPPEILSEQRTAILAHKPQFAIIAGGRPDQAFELERAGIHTYLHVPSPALLEQFIEQGARHFIFEGRECGGHIGPLSSFVLWSRMVTAILQSDIARPEQIHVLLAGGIHDAASAAMASVIGAPLAQAGIRVGVLMGTGYIFTQEAVASGAITPQFQQVAVKAEATAGLATGPGHASRCVVTPFVEEFHAHRRELEQRGVTSDDLRESLEGMTLGRLRLATKGLQRRSPKIRELVQCSDELQRTGGMFMIGQAVTLRNTPTTVAALHSDVSSGSHAILKRFVTENAKAGVARQPCDIAIVGISTFLPGAPDARAYWDNILGKIDAITEIPADRWDWRPYYSEDRNARDKIYSKWGGFTPDIPFDPVKFGIPPSSVSAIDPMQLLALAAVHDVLRDAGLDKQDENARESTSVIIGFSGGVGERGAGLVTRTELRRCAASVDDNLLDALPEWTPDSFAGILPNVSAGRAANRFDFGGVNFSVDAACASSLSAIYQAVLELESRRSDVVIAGGVDTVQGPFGFTCFAKAQALSPSGRCRTFDASADGIAISDGVAMVALKRLSDAERDGDRIYAVIKGVGGSSDGKAKGLMAPSPNGQVRALRRAYDQAGFPCSSVGLIEAHGTGTLAGDRAELESLGMFLEGADPKSVAIGSVKTMIGHTKSTAGAAGLVKVALALHEKILPPHLGVTQPNPALQTLETPLYLNCETRPWLKPSAHPRRGAVSSFGFGGTNFHVAIEEYSGEFDSGPRLSRRLGWPAELFVWRAPSRETLQTAVRQTRAQLEKGSKPRLQDLAHALIKAAPQKGVGAAIVASSLAELSSRLDVLIRRLSEHAGPPLPGIYFEAAPLGGTGSLAVLFSGQGSQYPDMLRELAATFSPMREMLEQADQILGATPTFEKKGPLTRLIYPPDRFTDAEKASDQKALTATDVAQPALGAASMGIWRLLQKLGVRAEMLGGHSYGEFTALHAAGVLSLEDLLLLSEARGRFITQSAADGDLGTMAAALASEDVIHPLMDGIKDIVLANYNAPGQIILSGPREAIAEAIRRLESAGITAKAIPVAAAFHSELMQPAQKPLAERMAKCEWSEARVAVYSNTTGARHGTTAATRDLMARHLIEPVRFSQMIDAMYAEGARIFLEVGPRSVLADLVRANLQARPGASIAVDSAGRGVTGLLAALGALFAHGVEMDLTVLTRDRIIDEFDAAAMPKPAKQSPTVWMINGGQTKPPASYTPPKAVNGETSVPVGTKTASILDRTAPAAMKPASTSTTPIAGNSARPHVAQPAKQLSSVTHKVHESEGEVTVSSDGSESYGYSDQQSAVLIEYFALMRQFMQVQENVVMSYLGAAPQPPAFGTANLFQSGTQIATGIIGGHRLGPGPGAPAPNRTVQAPLSNGYKPNGSGSNGHSPNGQLSNGQETSARAVSNQAIQPATSVSSNNSNAANSVIASTPSASPTSSANGHSNGAETRQGVAPKNGNAAPIEVESMLVALIADRTGYPPEMLSLDADIEADLGIDSIKRVEILGALRKELPSGLRDALEPHLPALVKAKTLSVIVSIVKQCAGGPAGEATTPFSQGNSPNKNTAPSYPAS